MVTWRGLSLTRQVGYFQASTVELARAIAHAWGVDGREGVGGWWGVCVGCVPGVSGRRSIKVEDAENALARSAG